MFGGRERVILGVALVQLLLGGVLAVAMSDRVVPSAPDPGTMSMSAGAASPGASGDPTVPDAAVPSASEREAPDPDATAGSVKPPPAGAQAPPPLELHGTYDQLKPDEQRYVASDPPYEPMVEGRLVDGTFWRVSAYQRPTGQICFETSRWDPEKNSGGSGGGGQVDCKGNSTWEWGMTASGDRFVALVGYAPVNAHEVELVTKDDRRGRVGGVFKTAMGVSFFAAWIECGGPDLDRMDALDPSGKVVSTLSFKDFPQGMPSWFCDFIKESG